MKKLRLCLIYKPAPANYEPNTSIEDMAMEDRVLFQDELLSEVERLLDSDGPIKVTCEPVEDEE